MTSSSEVRGGAAGRRRGGGRPRSGAGTWRRELPSLRQLHYFVLLAEAGRFKQAAERAGVSLPSLSVQISNLEGLLGFRLVERVGGRAALTAEGRAVAEKARAILAEAEGIMDLSRTLRHGMGGTIRMGSSPTLGPYLLPRVVAELHRRYPGLGLYVREGAPRDLVDDLARGEHDMALIQLPVVGPDLEVRRLFREPLMLCVPADHPLAGRNGVVREDLEGLTVLTLGPSFSLHMQVATLCRELGCRLSRDYEGTSLDALRLMTGMGMGVTFLPALYVRSEIGPHETDVRVLSVERPKLTRSIGLVGRPGLGGEGLDRIADAILAVARADFADVLTIEA
jgi:LysR family hydrogen peroxide-inducible transcriptional activator